MKLSDLVLDLVKRDEEEWFEFKENWFNVEEIGKYISALSNAAAVSGQDDGYLIWGVNDATHALVGTHINYQCHYEGEPLQNYLARNLTPSIAFTFQEIELRKKRMVVLKIPAAKKVPTAFKRIRYGRIGSSIVRLDKYPEREGLLWKTLISGYPTMINTESPTQNLTFFQLKNYYLAKGMLFNDEMFKENLHLLTEEGKYNMLACFLADNGEIPVRVSIFAGGDKSAPLFSVKEFGNQSLVSVIDRIIDYADSINMLQAVEHLETGVREDIPMFDQECFNEALKNAIIHNNWLRKVAPMIIFFDDRVEITSFSSLAPNQTLEGFYKGHSIPVNEELSAIFLATHLSERTGKGNPLIVSRFGREAFTITEAYIKVTIPYYWKKHFVAKFDQKVATSEDELSKTYQEILKAIKKYPGMTQPQIAKKVGVGKTTVQNAIVKFKQLGLIERRGSNKRGYWEIITKE